MNLNDKQEYTTEFKQADGNTWGIMAVIKNFYWTQAREFCIMSIMVGLIMFIGLTSGYMLYHEYLQSLC